MNHSTNINSKEDIQFDVWCINYHILQIIPTNFMFPNMIPTTWFSEQLVHLKYNTINIS